MGRAGDCCGISGTPPRGFGARGRSTQKSNTIEWASQLVKEPSPLNPLFGRTSRSRRAGSGDQPHLPSAGRLNSRPANRDFTRRRRKKSRAKGRKSRSLAPIPKHRGSGLGMTEGKGMMRIAVRLRLGDALRLRSLRQAQGLRCAPTGFRFARGYRCRRQRCQRSRWCPPSRNCWRWKRKPRRAHWHSSQETR